MISPKIKTLIEDNIDLIEQNVEEFFKTVNKTTWLTKDEYKELIATIDVLGCWDTAEAYMNMFKSKINNAYVDQLKLLGFGIEFKNEFDTVCGSDFSKHGSGIMFQLMTSTVKDISDKGDYEVHCSEVVALHSPALQTQMVVVEKTTGKTSGKYILPPKSVVFSIFDIMDVNRQRDVLLKWESSCKEALDMYNNSLRAALDSFSYMENIENKVIPNIINKLKAMPESQIGKINPAVRSDEDYIILETGIKTKSSSIDIYIPKAISMSDKEIDQLFNKCVKQLKSYNTRNKTRGTGVRS